MDYYEELKKYYIKGWNTWNTRSVLSHVLLPEGFAINLGIKEYKEGLYLKEALIGRFGEDDEVIQPGPHEYDGSYTELNLKWKGLEIIIQSAQDKDDLVILVTPVVQQISTSLLIIESGMLWNREGTLSSDGERLIVKFKYKTIFVFPAGKLMVEPTVSTQTPYLAIAMDSPVGVSTGKKRSIDEIKDTIEKKKAEHSKKKERYGELAEAYNALQSCAAWDTIYDPKKDRVVTPVSRLWNVRSGGYTLFCWDNYFSAYVASLDNKELAYSNAIEMTREKTPAGFVPNCAWGNGFTSYDRSQPPVGSMVVRELYRRFGDKWLLKELFDDLFAWNTWFINNRSTKDGALAWGSDPYSPHTGNIWETLGVNDSFGCALESGLDNSPMYDDIPFNSQKNMMQQADVGLTSLYIMDCDSLAEIADVLNKNQEAAELRSRAKKVKDSLAMLWDETSGLFLNKRLDTDKFSNRISPTNFYALFSDQVSSLQIERMLSDHFYNPEEFWGEWIMPSIARNDAAYHEQDAWRGRIWAPMNFLVYLGFRKHKLSQPCKDLADKSLKLIMKEWLACGHVHENYHADTGDGCGSIKSDKFYLWGSLLSLIALMEAGYVEGPENPI